MVPAMHTDPAPKSRASSSPSLRSWRGLVLTLLLGFVIHQTLQALAPSPSPADLPGPIPPEPSSSFSPAPGPSAGDPALDSMLPETAAENILLEYLDSRPEDRTALRGRLVKARDLLEVPNPEIPHPGGPMGIRFQSLLYLTFLTEELGEGEHRKKDLDPYEAVCYDYIFANPRQSAAEFIRLRQEYADRREVFPQLGGGLGTRFSGQNVPPTEALLDRLGDLEGKRVLEIGGGLGLLAWQAARRVGPTGKVYLVEIDPSLGDFVEYTRTRPGFQDLAPRLEFRMALAPEDPGVSAVDVVVMHDVHLVCNRSLGWFRQKMLPNLVRSLNPNGRLAIQEGFRADTDQEKILQVLTEAGFRLVSNTRLPYDPGFSMVVERP